MAPNVCRKTSDGHLFGDHTKKRSAKVAQLFGKIWAKILCNPKTLLAPTPMIDPEECQNASWCVRTMDVSNAVR